ncbi:MAG: serine/threonine-protein kinase [Burkholderiales bacterium]
MATNASFDTPFDNYRVKGVIGEGGAGQVYEVVNSAEELFALKCLAPERVTSDRRKRFKNEITFCQKADHPNIVKVLDAGVALINDVKCPFYVMRRYSGTLRTHLRQITANDALRVFSQILDGVEAAHLAGVWHRDLKPENILWNERDEALVIADFGIAHFEEEELYTAVETKAAARLANFLYSAPEQRVRGTAVDRRADIYSLGLILNELFTKEVPQGAGFKRVRDADAAFGYIDELVDPMIQQNPANRPSTIEEVKKELIGRKNAFVALQEYDAATKKVVPAAQPPEFRPLALVGFDYVNGTLTLKLSGNVQRGWAQEFQHPRGGHSEVMGYGPERFQIRGDTITIGVPHDERLIQRIIDNAKSYVAAANRGYIEQQELLAARQDREQRAALERKVVEADLRRNILAKIRL